MSKFQFLAIFKKPAVLLGLVVLVFFLKGVFLATLIPFISGQDEPKHYNTVQFLAEPKNDNPHKGEIKIKRLKKEEQDMLETYNLTEEIQETAKATNYDEARHNQYSTQEFSQSFMGEREEEIMIQKYSRINISYPPAMIKKTKLYHYFGSFVEKFYSDESVFVRFYAVRIYSVVLGCLCILLFYFISKNVGISIKNSLLISAIGAFHPMLAQTSSTVNYDILLILLFTFFTFCGVLILKNGFNWIYLVLLAVAFLAGLATKGPAFVLIVPIFFILLQVSYKKSGGKNKLKFFAYVFLAMLIPLIIFYFVIDNYYLDVSRVTPSIFGRNIQETAQSLSTYIDKSFAENRFSLSSKTYWLSTSNLLKGGLADSIIKSIWLIEAIAALGIIWLLFFKKNTTPGLPEKKYILLFLLMIFALQLVIRVFDWRFFENNGAIEFATSGRYYLPNLISHLILAAAGIGTILRKEKFLELFLKITLVAMVFLSTYLIFMRIIPLYYF